MLIYFLIGIFVAGMTYYICGLYLKDDECLNLSPLLIILIWPFFLIYVIFCFLNDLGIKQRKRKNKLDKNENDGIMSLKEAMIVLLQLSEHSLSKKAESRKERLAIQKVSQYIEHGRFPFDE